jgi:hypothetical protein
MSIIPGVHIPSTVLPELKDVLNSLLCTENVPAPIVLLDQLVVPLSEIVPFVNVKSSNQKTLAAPNAGVKKGKHKFNRINKQQVLNPLLIIFLGNE